MQKTIKSPGNVRLVKWLKEKRTEKGFTMRQLGKMIGKPHSVIGKIEQEDRRLDAVELVAYCEALGLDPHDAINVIKGDSA